MTTTTTTTTTSPNKLHDPLPICDQRTITTTKQTIYFLRHGVALHNLPIIIHNPTKTTTYRNANLHDPKYTDSKLVLPKGYQQSKLAGRRLLNDLLYHYSYDKNGKNIINHNNENDDKKIYKLLDYVFVSPLSRCFETAYFVMEEMERGINNHNHNNHNNTEYKIDTNIPWICKEDLREAYGIHYSDKRSCRSFLEVSLYNTNVPLFYIIFHSNHSLKL